MKPLSTTRHTSRTSSRVTTCQHILVYNKTSRSRDNSFPKIDQQPLQVLMKIQIPLRATTPTPFVNPATHKVTVCGRQKSNKSLGSMPAAAGWASDACTLGNEARTAPWPPAAAIYDRTRSWGSSPGFVCKSTVASVYASFIASCERRIVD